VVTTAGGPDDAAPYSADDLNRLRWRCRRGMLELDLVLARFLETRLDTLGPAQLREFEHLLALEDQALWQRLRTEAPAPTELERMLREAADGETERD
jgi:antitoxin CptB